jgi:hypothetical protein
MAKKPPFDERADTTLLHVFASARVLGISTETTEVLIGIFNEAWEDRYCVGECDEVYSLQWRRLCERWIGGALHFITQDWISKQASKPEYKRESMRQ